MKDIARYLSSLEHIVGVSTIVLQDGQAYGVRATRVINGGGLDFLVINDRALDIGDAYFYGIPLMWKSRLGYVHPSYYEATDRGFLNAFGGGLFTTCGLSQVGDPCVDESGEQLGLHGRISGIPARNISVNRVKNNNTMELIVSGEVLEGNALEKALLLYREIKTTAFSNSIQINDRIENIGTIKSPFMLLYHFNFGFPLLSESSKIVLPHGTIVQKDSSAVENTEDLSRFLPPSRDAAPQVFYVYPDTTENYVVVAIQNPTLFDSHGLEVKIRYPKAVLPYLVHWRYYRENIYVVGLEPANCHVEGQIAEKNRGTLRYLDPGESVSIDIDISLGFLEPLKISPYQNLSSLR